MPHGELERALPAIRAQGALLQGMARVGQRKRISSANRAGGSGYRGQGPGKHHASRGGL